MMEIHVQKILAVQKQIIYQYMKILYLVVETMSANKENKILVDLIVLHHEPTLSPV